MKREYNLILNRTICYLLSLLFIISSLIFTIKLDNLLTTSDLATDKLVIFYFLEIVLLVVVSFQYIASFFKNKTISDSIDGLRIVNLLLIFIFSLVYIISLFSVFGEDSTGMEIINSAIVQWLVFATIASTAMLAFVDKSINENEDFVIEELQQQNQVLEEKEVATTNNSNKANSKIENELQDQIKELKEQIKLKALQDEIDTLKEQLLKPKK